ncbi:MAG: HDOD domain-containing protein [Gammaproteobacteria bacterium]|nr:HDOD domain-containing protein [Gammaproteobacteria bacterium]
MGTGPRKPSCRSSGPCEVPGTPTASVLPPSNIFIGRQGIFDRSLGIYGYELLYRSSEHNAAGQFDGEQATSTVAINAFLEMGLDQVVGNHLAFLNLTRKFLTGEYPIPFPKERVVLEVLEDIPIDEELIAGIKALSAQGYTLALDDCLFTQRLCGLLPHAQIIKIDIRAASLDTIAAHVERFRAYPVKLVAEKIETQEEFERCRDLGFDYFQGYFLCVPKVLSGQRIPDNKLTILELLSKLQDPEIQAAELETLVSQDLSLSLKLLRYINSAFFALPGKIESIHQALVYIGTRVLRTWVTLLVLRGAEDTPTALMTTALARAKMCELLAAHAGIRDVDTYFTVGMFSVVDAILGIPMERILKSLPFSDAVSSALLERRGQLGAALSCAVAYESGQWDQVKFGTLAADAIARIYLDSITWADTLGQNLR